MDMGFSGGTRANKEKLGAVAGRLIVGDAYDEI
jgi:hypothetical protein